MRPAFGTGQSAGIPTPLVPATARADTASGVQRTLEPPPRTNKVMALTQEGRPVDETDEQLVGWSVAGDTAAFVDLFWRHGPAVHAYLARRAGRQNADDLLSDVWLRAFKGRASWHGPEVLPWLYGIAHNVLRAHWRQGARLQPVVPLLDGTDPWPDVDARLDAQAQHELIREVLGSLSEDEREVLLLVVWEQLTPAQVAITLGIPQGTARSRLHRALSTLRGDGLPSVVICSRSKED